MKAAKRPKLEPCPFCGGQDITIDSTAAEDGHIRFDWYVVCNFCDSSTGVHITKAAAIEAWNHRA